VYGPEIELWIAGALIGELLLQRPLFSADKEVGVFGMIVEELGTPLGTKADAFLKTLPYWKDFLSAIPAMTTQRQCKTETALVHAVSRNAWDLIGRMLTYDPKQRISAAAAAEHEFFKESPEACSPAEIRVPQDDFCHGMSMKQKRERSDRDSAPPTKRSKP
jgi:serine/threonine protein kinase